MAKTKEPKIITPSDRLKVIQDNYVDISKTGPLSYRELQYLVGDTSEYTPSNENSARAEIATRPLDSFIEKDLNVQYTQDTDYGNSMFDPEGFATPSEIAHLGDVRANNQPLFAQIGAGIAKMGILAGTTFTDGIIGSIAGLINLGIDAANGNIDSAKDAFWSFIDNPFSEAMQQINETAEKWLPNYYTEEEQTSPWYTQLWTSNFIGDKFLKNLGFTIGAAGAAMVSAGLGSKVLLKKGIRDAFKGVVVNSAGKELKTGAQIYKAYRTGDALMDGAKLTEDLGKAAKQLKNAEWKLKLLGAVTSAAGEGRIEAITNANQWEQSMLTPLEDQHNSYPKKLMDDMYEKHPEWFGKDIEGNRILINEGARQEYNAKIAAEQQNYENAKAAISEQKAAVGNSIFGLNLALLTASNSWQFGRAMVGGYAAGRTAKSLVRGSVKEGFTANKSIARAKRIRAWSNPFMEAQEEMSQASISEGSGMWGSSNINNQFGSFYGGKIDPDTEANIQGWLGNIVQGFANAYGDINRWEEGFIGGLTGLLGIPKIKLKTKENGKKGLSFSLDGELWQGLKEAKQIKEDANNIAAALNKRVKDPEFLNYYQGMIRHNSYQATMDGALDAGDEFEFKNAEHSQMISDAIMFDKAGRLQDLYDIIAESGNVSLEDVKTLRELSVDKQTGKSIYDSMTDEQVVEQAKSQADKMKKTVDKYVEISNNLKTLYGDRIDPTILEELTWGMTQVDNWEGRLEQLTKEIRNNLTSKAQAIKERFGIDINVVLDNLVDFGNNFSSDKNLVNEINDIINDKNLTVQEGRDKIEAAIKSKQQEEKSNNLALGRKVTELRKKFKESATRLEKQREKALAQMEKLDPEQRRIRNLRDQEVEDYNKYVEQSKAALKGALSILKQIRNSRKLRKGREFTDTRNRIFDTYEEEIKQQLQQLEEGRVDIYHSFSGILDKIDAELAWAEATFDTDRVLDKRFKKGYDPNSRPVTIGSGIQSSRPIYDEEGKEKQAPRREYEVVSEAEAEERHRVREKNYNILFELIDLKKALDDPNNKLMSPLDVQRLDEKFLDLAKIIAVRTKFIDTYQKLSVNPQLAQEEINKQIRSAIAANVEKQVNAGVEALENVSSVTELRAVLESLENPEYIPQILDKVKEGDNKELISIVEEYESIENMRQIILGTGEDNPGIVGSMQFDTENEAKKHAAAAAIINDTLDTAESLKEAKQNLGKEIIDAEKDDKGLAKALKQILDRYAELENSNRSKKNDKKSKKEVKKRAHVETPEEKKSAFESLDEEDTPDFTDEDSNNDNDEGTDEGTDENTDEDDIDEDDINKDEEGDENTDEDDDLDTSDDSDSDDTDIVKSLKEMSEEELDEVIDGTSDLLKNFSDKDKATVKEIAELIKQQRKSPSVHNDGKGTNAEFRLEPVKKGNSVHRSWRVTGYKIDPLKDRRERKAIPLKHPIADALRDLGAFDFVDNGSLGVLLNENPDLTIHYITVPSNNNLKDTVLLAIEVTDEVKELVKVIKPKKGSDGKYYQVVGSLGFDKYDKAAARNYNDIVKGLEAERRTLNNSSATYIVSQKYKNKVSHIYSGRIVKSTEDRPVSKINLKDLLGKKEKPHFGIYFSDTDFRTPTLQGEQVVKPNKNNTNPREGSIWLMTREADGRYYAKAVQVKRFTNEEWDFEKHKNTPVMEEIREALRTIADSEASDVERAKAKLTLGTLLYFPSTVNSEGKKTRAGFVFTGDIVSLKDEHGKNIANNIGEGLSAEEKAEEMLKELEKLNLRFQVSVHKLSTSKSYVEDLMDSDILFTDLAKVHNVNASFDMPLLDPTTGKPLLNVKPEETKGHTGIRGIQSSLASTTIMIGRNRYSLYEDGTVKIDDKEVTDQDIIDEVVFRDKVAKGIIQPVEGNSNLYLGVYSSGKEFGLLNGRLRTGEELEKLKDKASKNIEKNKQKNNRRKVEENIDESDDDDDDIFGNIDRTGIIEKDDTDENDTDEDDDDDIFGNITRKNIIVTDDNNDDDSDESDDTDDDDDDIFGNIDRTGIIEKDDESDDDSDDESDEDNSDDEDTEEEDDKPKSKSKSKPKLDVSLGEEFNPSGRPSPASAAFNKLMIANRKLWKDVCSTFVELKQKAAELGIDTSTITTQKQFEGLITEIRCHK